MAASSPRPKTLALDIGGTGIKALVLDPAGKPLSERQRVETPKPATPKAVLAAIEALVKPLGEFDRVSCGFPGVVIEGTTKTAPNLHETWTAFPLAKSLKDLLGKPSKVLNDAGIQGFGAITGKGTELVVTLGTGMGFALYIDGNYVPNIELAHHPLRKGLTYEQYIGNAAMEEVGKKKWNKRVVRVIGQLDPIFNPTRIFLGGGNTKHLTVDLPAHVKKVENVAGLLGGIALWGRPEAKK